MIFSTVKKRKPDKKWLLVESNKFAANQICKIVYSSEDFERFYLQYQDIGFY